MLGERIALARERAGLTQEELGKAVGLSQQAINQLEINRTKTTRKLSAIAKALSVSTDWLLTGQEATQKTIPPQTAGEELSPRQRAFLELIESLPSIEQDKLMRELEDKKYFFKKVFEEMKAKAA